MENESFETFVLKELRYIRGRVDKLWDFRMLLIGGSIVVSGITGLVVSLVAIYFGAR